MENSPSQTQKCRFGVSGSPNGGSSLHPKQPILTFVHHWSWKYFWNSPPRWPGWEWGNFFFIPFQISLLGMWGVLRKSWVFALTRSHTKKDWWYIGYIPPLPLKKNNSTKKNSFCRDLSTSTRSVFLPFVGRKKTSTPSRPHHCPGLSGYSWERAPRNF